MTDQGTPGFVPAGERVAAFDNHGTLKSEQRLYFQGYLALAEVKSMAADSPEWNILDMSSAELAEYLRSNDSALKPAL